MPDEVERHVDCDGAPGAEMGKRVKSRVACVGVGVEVAVEEAKGVSERKSTEDEDVNGPDRGEDKGREDVDRETDDLQCNKNKPVPW